MISCAFTLVLNGLHHFLHNDYANNFSNMVDYWIITEGASSNKGSTSWCNTKLPQFHKNGRSVDLTYEFLQDFVSSHKNTFLIAKEGGYDSKDEQVAMAIEKIKILTKGDECFLWQVDSDEQWDKDSLRKAETMLLKSGQNIGKFYWNYYLGPGLLAKGVWGEAYYWRGIERLWRWKSNAVIKHEPPKFSGLSSEIILPQRMNHYAYYFRKDVLFKSLWYRGYERILANWDKLQATTGKKIPLSLFLDGVDVNVPVKVIQNSWIERLHNEKPKTEMNNSL